MKEKAKELIKQNAHFLNSINEIMRFFRKHKNLKHYAKNYHLKDYDLIVTFERSKKYEDCLDFKIQSMSFEEVENCIFMDNQTDSETEAKESFIHLKFENVEYRHILKNCIIILLELYHIKNFQSNHIEQILDDKKSFYEE